MKCYYNKAIEIMTIRKKVIYFSLKTRKERRIRKKIRLIVNGGNGGN